MEKDIIVKYIEANKKTFIDLAKKIWDNPEKSLEEEYASNLQIDMLKNKGFKIKKYNIPNAFMAEYGNGKPILGVLGEYDALAGLSQKVSKERESIEGQLYGHGCGHNLLGVGSLSSAMAIKEAIESKKINGTIRYYGCPAEETIGGKVLMDEVHAFDDLDACLVWHPNNKNFIRKHSGLALKAISFEYYGESTHASSTPHLGKNALHGVEIMNIGVNFLREQLLNTTRIHYVINNGGLVPNVTPDYSKASYQIRDIDMKEVERIFQKVLDIAKGAALMTGTEVSYEVNSKMKSILYNESLSKIVYNNMIEQYKYDYTDKEIEFGKDLNYTTGVSDDEIVFHKEVSNWNEDYGAIFGSNDVGEVSHRVPLATFFAATTPYNVRSHSWQATASHGSSIGFKGMLFAGKVLTATLYDLYSNLKLIEDAKSEFKKKI